METGGFPYVFKLSGVAFFQFGQDIRAAVAAAGGAGLPEVGCRHVLEVSPGSAEFRAMEDWFAGFQFFENIQQGRIGNQSGFRVRAHRAIVNSWVAQPTNELTLATQFYLRTRGRPAVSQPPIASDQWSWP